MSECFMKLHLNVSLSVSVHGQLQLWFTRLTSVNFPYIPASLWFPLASPTISKIIGFMLTWNVWFRKSKSHKNPPIPWHSFNDENIILSWEWKSCSFSALLLLFWFLILCWPNSVMKPRGCQVFSLLVTSLLKQY